MSLTIVSSVPSYGYGTTTSGSFLIYAPNLTNGNLTIAQVMGLQAELDAKLNDNIGQIGTNVIVSGSELNQLHLSGAVNADFVKLHAITATASQINSAATTIKYGPGDFTAANQIFLGTGVGTGSVTPLATALAAQPISALGQATSTINMNANRIINVADPTNPQDAATRAYVLSVLGGGGQFLPTDGSGHMSGNLDLRGNSIVMDADGNSLFQPGNDVVNFILGGTAEFTLSTTSLDMHNNRLTNLADPSSAQDGATKNYTDNTYLSKAGGVLTGTLDLDGHNLFITADGNTYIDAGTNSQFKVTVNSSPALAITTTAINALSKPIQNVTDPTNPQDAATKNYVSTTFLDRAGTNTMTGGINMGGNTISNIGDPTVGSQVGSRTYNDARYLKIGSNLSDLGNVATARTNLGLATVAATGYFTDLIGAPTVPAKLDDLTDVNVGTPGLGQNGQVLKWDNTSGQFILTSIPVTSVFGRTGAVIASPGDYTAAQVTNTPGGNISSTTVQAALNELDTEKLALAGGIMSGNINMNGNTITAMGSLGVGSHSFTGTVYTSSTAGNSFYIRTSNAATASTPTYSFNNRQTSGIYWDGTQISFSVGGTLRAALSASALDMQSHTVSNLANPSSSGDAVSLGFLQGQMNRRVLGYVTGVNLMAGAGVATAIYQVPAGKRHFITKIIVNTTSYSPGASPTDPTISIGTTGPNYDQIISTMVISFGASGSADQMVQLDSDQGAVTPNTSDTIYVQKDSLAAGTFSAFVVDIYVIGFEK